MSTLEFVSAEFVSASALVAGLGAHPTLTAPLRCGRTADVAPLWRRLDEAARFFGTAIPPVTALHDAVHGFLAETAARYGEVTVAARIQLLEVGGHAGFVVSGTVIEPVRAEPVAVAVRPGPVEDRTPHWRRMAARTSSAAEADLHERELRGAGYADVVYGDGALIGGPRLGALIVETRAGMTGLGTDRLMLLQPAGLLDTEVSGAESVVLAETKRAWWVSPRFETHPVRVIGTHHFEPEVPGHE